MMEFGGMARKGSSAKTARRKENFLCYYGDQFNCSCGGYGIITDVGAPIVVGSREGAGEGTEPCMFCSRHGGWGRGSKIASTVTMEPCS